MPSRDEQIARMAAQKAAVELVKDTTRWNDATTLQKWIDFFYDDIMDLDDDDDSRTVAEVDRLVQGAEKLRKAGDRPLTEDEEAKVLNAIKQSGKKVDLILAAIGKDKAENLTVHDSKQIKAILGS